MCKWSSDWNYENISESIMPCDTLCNCCLNNNCSEYCDDEHRHYSQISKYNGSQSIFDLIIGNILVNSEINSDIFSEGFVTIFPDVTEYKDIPVDLNELNCNVYPANCSPDYIQFQIFWEKGEGSVILKNLRMDVLDSCEGTNLGGESGEGGGGSEG
jgi:hypothetical protein